VTHLTSATPKIGLSERTKLRLLVSRGSYPTKPVYDGQKAAVQDDDPFAQRPPRDEHVFHQYRQVGPGEQPVSGGYTFTGEKSQPVLQPKRKGKTQSGERSVVGLPSRYFNARRAWCSAFSLPVFAMSSMAQTNA